MRSEIEVDFLSSLTRTTVPSRINRMIGSSVRERAFQASQSPLTLRQTRLTVSLPTAPRHNLLGYHRACVRAKIARRLTVTHWFTLHESRPLFAFAGIAGYGLASGRVRLGEGDYAELDTDDLLYHDASQTLGVLLWPVQTSPSK
jgi:hypothetical protein